MDYGVVAFLDVLGFSEMVERDSRAVDQKYLPIFLDVFMALDKDFSDVGVSIKMFSDSIIVAADLSPESVVSVIKAASEMQKLFLSRDILIRGGISFGKHFSNEKVTFSQALVYAYKIESQQARFPRVVVSKDTVGYAWHNEKSTQEIRGQLSALLLTDKDGATFINYLGCGAGSMRDFVQRCISSRTESASVVEKHRWLYDYYNYSASISGENLLDEGQFVMDFSKVEFVA